MSEIRDPYATPAKPGEFDVHQTAVFLVPTVFDAQGRICDMRQATEAEQLKIIRAYARRSKKYRDSVLERALQPDEIREMLAGTATLKELYERKGLPIDF